MEYWEPHLEERIELAKKRASKIITGDIGGDEELLFDCLRFQLCLKLKKPFFDSYFDTRTIDDLIFELELYKLLEKDTVQSAGEMLASATPSEVDEMFKDIPLEADDKFLEDSKKFMETGEFK
jgi:hypothetical protein